MMDEAAGLSSAGAAQTDIEILQFIDAALGARALIYGSVPPEARDVDVLVRPAELTALTAHFKASGFVCHGDHWARFRDCTVDIVELVPSERWGLPTGEVAALFEAAILLEGMKNVARPSPRHALLILARQFAGRGGALPRKHRSRIEAALDEEPGAWEAARLDAPAWGGSLALELLHDSFESGRPASLPKRVRAAVGSRASCGGSRATAWAATCASLVPRPHRGVVVALSGIDGSGKTFHARVLQATLEKLGHEAVVEWSRITLNPSVSVVGDVAKRVLQVRTGRKGPAARLGAPSSADDIGKLVRQRNPFINHAWITYIALLNVRAHRRAARHRGRGRVVICDRYVLDSIVHLRRKYGDYSWLGFETMLIRAMSPKPSAAFLLDIDPELAFVRKPDEFGVADLREFRDLYQSECDALGAVRVDTAQPPPATCRAIAETIWAAFS